MKTSLSLVLFALIVSVVGGCANRQTSSLVGDQVAVEEISALNGVRIFYYSPDDSVEQLLAIAEKYKGEYQNKAMVEILFFDDRQNTPQALPMNDYGVACHVAKFEWIPSQGKQVLQRRRDGWKELNQGL